MSRMDLDGMEGSLGSTGWNGVSTTIGDHLLEVWGQRNGVECPLTTACFAMLSHVDKAGYILMCVVLSRVTSCHAESAKGSSWVVSTSNKLYNTELTTNIESLCLLLFRVKLHYFRHVIKQSDQVQLG